jgi:alginate O-acetyltransferase complex protein AlgI
VGFLIFTIGLFKKIVIVGSVAPASDNLFNGVAMGLIPSFVDSWVGVLSFSLQIYFDFSAYSDMAIGLSKMMGILLPINFDSPYKSNSFIDFWRRWHITLSTFLREYLYFNLGGNKKGINRQYINILIVMSLAGLWHGASWLFVIWGILHGVFLVLNHIVRFYNLFKVKKIFSIPIIFILVSVLWVPFRADSLNSMTSILQGLIGLNGIKLPFHYQDNYELINFLVNLSLIDVGALNVYAGGWQIVTLFLLIMFVFFLPNTQQITSEFQPVLEKIDNFHFTKFKFKFNGFTGIICGLFFYYILILSIQGKPGEFIYFQF